MKAWKQYYDEAKGKFDLVEFVIPHEYNFDFDPETNFDKERHSHNCTYESIKSGVDKLNADVANGKFDVVKCKDCGIFFLLSADEKEWFDTRELSYPKRCKSCRNRRKTY